MSIPELEPEVSSFRRPSGPSWSMCCGGSPLPSQFRSTGSLTSQQSQISPVFPPQGIYIYSKGYIYYVVSFTTGSIQSPSSPPQPVSPLSPPWLCASSALLWSDITRVSPGSLCSGFTLVTLHHDSAADFWASGCISALHPFGSLVPPSPPWL